MNIVTTSFCLLAKALESRRASHLQNNTFWSHFWLVSAASANLVCILCWLGLTLVKPTSVLIMSFKEDTWVPWDSNSRSYSLQNFVVLRLRFVQRPRRPKDLLVVVPGGQPASSVNSSWSLFTNDDLQKNTTSCSSATWADVCGFKNSESNFFATNTNKIFLL